MVPLLNVSSLKGHCHEDTFAVFMRSGQFFAKISTFTTQNVPAELRRLRYQ